MLCISCSIDTVRDTTTTPTQANEQYKGQTMRRLVRFVLHSCHNLVVTLRTFD